eukprot:gnl/TRDRNA2_/TRDRNA2_208937_c0_seq1.p1 gnl/TRDRNA2_/TRDRNA2_208937_c0~~gnl/TRDRNA2_/TRDRNA2_208937_c0_seq1.p1  ORF type:complete len:228 (-),score=16.14 gnl/TRDRNA2_/TRDRNA2_208937_c0_seq1:40-723(-)
MTDPLMCLSCATAAATRGVRYLFLKIKDDAIADEETEDGLRARDRDGHLGADWTTLAHLPLEHFSWEHGILKAMSACMIVVNGPLGLHTVAHSCHLVVRIIELSHIAHRCRDLSSVLFIPYVRSPMDAATSLAVVTPHRPIMCLSTRSLVHREVVSSSCPNAEVEHPSAPRKASTTVQEQDCMFKEDGPSSLGCTTVNLGRPWPLLPALGEGLSELLTDLSTPVMGW